MRQPCGACIEGHIKQYESYNEVQLTIDGKLPEWAPRDALPDCVTCEKPDLHPSNNEAVTLYRWCMNQQQYNAFTGLRLGLRMEAVICALDELERQGRIKNRDRAFRRVWIIDRVVNQHVNKDIEQAQSKQ